MAERTAQTLYEILEVSSDATFEAIEAAYRGMLAYLGEGSLATYSMMEEDDLGRLRAELDEAYRTLCDPERRAAYDRSIGRGEHTYPSLMVPQAPSDFHVTLGRVMSSTSVATSAPPQETKPDRAAAAKADLHALATLPEESSAQKSSRATPPPRPPTLPIASVPSRPVVHAGVARTVRRLRPKPDFEITADTEYSGALLRRLRETADATLDDLAEITKVSKRYLRALEDSDFEALPAAVYVRGFVAEYARALGLDTTIVCKSYMSVYKRHRVDGG